MVRYLSKQEEIEENTINLCIKLKTSYTSRSEISHRRHFTTFTTLSEF